MADQTIDRADLTYMIGGNEYRLEPLSWQQHKWLADHIFAGIDMHRLDYPTIHDLLREKGPLFMAICLIGVGLTRAEHSRQPWPTITKHADQFAAEVTGAEVAAFGMDFFRSCLGSPGTMAMLNTGKAMQEVFEELRLSHAPGATGSSEASSVSAGETSPSSPPFLANGGQPNQTPISGDVSSVKPSIAPSLAGAGSSSHG